MVSENRLRAYLRLHLAEGVGAVTFRRLIEAFGDVEQAAGASPGQWQQVQGIGEKTAAAMAAVAPEHVTQELDLAREHGVAVLCLDDPAYPAGLKTIHDPPAVLYVRGRMTNADAVAMGIVGSRRCTHYGMEQAERFGQLLGRAGLTVVSGGARGIDTAAHRGALAAGGRTVAVMGCGLCQVYPEDNRRLFDEIVSGGRGAIVSELPMRTAVLGGNFPTRNRIISGLSLGVLIVEAARRSGSLITARDADEQGRVVFAVPGRVDSPLSEGTNELIREGAIMARNLDDVLEHLGQVGQLLTPGQEAPAAAPAALGPEERKLFDALAAGQLSLDEIVRASGVPSGQAASGLTMLVLKGAVVQRPGNIFARKGGR